MSTSAKSDFWLNAATKNLVIDYTFPSIEDVTESTILKEPGRFVSLSDGNRMGEVFMIVPNGTYAPNQYTVLTILSTGM